MLDRSRERKIKWLFLQKKPVQAFTPKPAPTFAQYKVFILVDENGNVACVDGSKQYYSGPVFTANRDEVAHVNREEFGGRMKIVEGVAVLTLTQGAS
jgi:hypothetical protein